MQIKKFGRGKVAGYTYMKKAGQGWETGFCLGSKSVFVGNFIHTAEARQWFGLMNRHLVTISKKYAIGSGIPTSWLGHFLGHSLYKSYYSYLDQVFARHNKAFTHAVVKDIKKYRQLKKGWGTNNVRPIFARKAA